MRRPLKLWFRTEPSSYEFTEAMPFFLTEITRTILCSHNNGLRISTVSNTVHQSAKNAGIQIGHNIMSVKICYQH